MFLICVGIVVFCTRVVAKIEIRYIRRIECRIYRPRAGVAYRACGQTLAFLHIVEAVVAVDVAGDIWFDAAFDIVDARIHLQLHTRLEAVVYDGG